ncbi:MAG TPA: hypothetical protein VFI42_11520 [Thermomicrobiaceae bacterium]|nr:hypothetical protein [Thermomicrobiaceae bacterium]
MAIAVGAQAPEFTVLGAQNAKTSLNDILAQGPAVLAFYFFAFTGG